MERGRERGREEKSLRLRAAHQEIVKTLVWPDRFDNSKSDWCHMISPDIELAEDEIMTKYLPTQTNGYHSDIIGQFWWKLYQSLSMPHKT